MSGGLFDGLAKVVSGINAEVAGVRDRTTAGCYAAGLKVQRASQKRVPVEYGVLRASAYTRKESDGATVGYSAAYALFVHENMEQTLRGLKRPSGLGVYWGPKGEAKFLERPFREMRQEILATVASYSSIRRK